MVQNDRTNLTPVGLRVVVGAWAIALLVAATLATAAGVVRLAQISRATAILENENRFASLSEALIPFFDRDRATFEQTWLQGQPLVAVTSSELEQTDVSQPGDERSVFRPAASARRTGSPAEVRVFRTQVDGSEISSQFAGWTVRLKFVDDSLRSVSAMDPRRASLSRPIRGISVIQSAMGYSIVVSGALAVICLIAAWRVDDRFRRPVAAVGLAGAVLVLVVTGVHINRHRSPLLVDNRAAGGWAIITLMLGLAACKSERPSANSQNKCRACGYDLTRNLSGRCPECGQPTAQGQVDRWETHAVAIARVQDDAQQFTSPVAPAPRSLELKLTTPPDGASRFIRALAGGPAACYRYNMSDPLIGSETSQPFDANGEPPAPETGDSTSEETPDIVCPACNYTITTGASPEATLTHCPACGVDLEAAQADVEFQQEQALRAEVERREREQHLNEVGIKQVLTERRALFRTRSYFVVIGVGALVVAIQLGIYTYYRLTRDDFGFRVGAYLAAILALAFLMRVCWRQVRRYNSELARPSLQEPAANPDFSTLSDGTQRLDTAAENLERLYKQQ